MSLQAVVLLIPPVCIPAAVDRDDHDAPDAADEHDRAGGGNQDPHARGVLEVKVVELAAAAEPEENAQHDEGQHETAAEKGLNVFHLMRGSVHAIDAVHIESKPE